MWLSSKESHKKLTYATKLHWKSVLPFVIPTEAKRSGGICSSAELSWKRGILCSNRIVISTGA
jgi:hypothetical protein